MAQWTHHKYKFCPRTRNQSSDIQIQKLSFAIYSFKHTFHRIVVHIHPEKSHSCQDFFLYFFFFFTLCSYGHNGIVFLSIYDMVVVHVHIFYTDFYRVFFMEDNNFLLLLLLFGIRGCSRVFVIRRRKNGKRIIKKNNQRKIHYLSHTLACV